MKQKLFLVLACLSTFVLATPVKIVVLTPTYNNERWCIKNLESVLEQTYQNVHHVIVNDCSTDATSTLLRDYIAVHNLSHRVTFIDNTERKGALQNLYNTIHALPDDVVVFTLDGDDWCANQNALQRVADEYKNPTVWMTYGQFQCWPRGEMGFCRKFPSKIITHNNFRKYEWVSSHPRTFYAWLFKKIKKSDLMLEGKFFAVTWDLAIMFPMLEMASKGHIRFIPDVLYIYNNENPLNDHRTQPGLQQWCNQLIRQKSKYKPL